MNGCDDGVRPTVDLVAAAERGVIEAAVEFVEWLATPPATGVDAHPLGVLHAMTNGLAARSAVVVRAVTRLERARAAARSSAPGTTVPPDLRSGGTGPGWLD